MSMSSAPDTGWSGITGPHSGVPRFEILDAASEIVYDATVVFCDRFIDRRSRTHDQMVQAARSGKQNIAEGSMASGTSRKTELKLVGVARASLEELLIDYQDFLRQRHALSGRWRTPAPKPSGAFGLYAADKSYKTYEPLLKNPESAANTLVCLIHQTNYLLDQQLRQLDQQFQKEGGFTEKLHRCRSENRSKPR